MLTEWYRGLRLPYWGNAMKSFLTPSIGLLCNMLPRRVPVVFSDDVDTAYADRENQRIVCGTSFFAVDENRRLNPFATREQALTFGLALITHEGAHFAWSPDGIPDLLENGIPNNKITSFIANIAEDIYIEEKVIRQLPVLSWAISGGWEYMFDPRIERSGPVWDGLTINDENVQSALNTFVGWKHQFRQFTFRSELEREFYDLFYSIIGQDSLAARKKIIAAIIEKISKFVSLPGAEKKNEVVIFTPSCKPMTLGELRRANASTGGQQRVQGVIGSVDEVSIENGKIVSLYSVGEYPNALPVSPTWRRFGELAAQRGAVRSVQGPASYAGKRLSHPLNAGGNGKVFSNSKLQSTSGRVGKAVPQVILLVDFSGSMRGSKYTAAISAAYGAAVGMADAGMSFAIYGYTSADGGISMHKVKEFNEHPSLALKRLCYLKSNAPSMNNTPDFEAISFASKKFQGNGSDKVLVVITDGAPSYRAAEQSSGDAIIDVRNLVLDLRKGGVGVFGLSINSASDTPVQKIYGERCSICSSDPNSISRFLSLFI